MKQGKSIIELATEISRQQSSKRDFLTNANKVYAFVHENNLNIGFPTDDDLFTGGLTTNGHIQLGNLCDIPKRYYDKLLACPDLLRENVGHWLGENTDKRMFRILDGNVRAILSDKYRRLDNYDLAENILPMLVDAKADVESCEITENKIYIKAITHKV